MGILGRAELLLQAKNYSGTGAWLDESGNGHNATNNGALFKPHSGTDYLYLPGSASNYVSTADVNLLDADTAHIQQSIGDWQNAAGTTLSLVANSASPFGDNALNVLVNTTGSNRQIYTSGGRYDISPGDVTAVVSITNVSVVDDLGATLRLNCRTSGDSLVNLIDQAITLPAAGQTAWFSVSGTANATTAQGYFGIILDNGTLNEVLRVNAVCVRQDDVAVFVPSLRIVGDLDIEAKVASPTGHRRIQENFHLPHRLGRHQNRWDLHARTLKPPAADAIARYGDGDRARGNTSKSSALTD